MMQDASYRQRSVGSRAKSRLPVVLVFSADMKKLPALQKSDDVTYFSDRQVRHRGRGFGQTFQGENSSR
jgi:hypothetical protein